MERRKMNCEVRKPVADAIKEWAIAHNVECFRSECYDNIYVEMNLTESEANEVDELIDDTYNHLLECECDICGSVGMYMMDDEEKDTLGRYYCYGRQMGYLQDLFPKIPAWIRSGCIDQYSGGFCICPSCAAKEEEAI